MIVHQPEDGPGRGWEDVGGGKMSAKMFRFLQRDIDEGRIWYKHMGASADDDFFTFEVWMQKIFYCICKNDKVCWLFLFSNILKIQLN